MLLPAFLRSFAARRGPGTSWLMPVWYGLLLALLLGSLGAAAAATVLTFTVTLDGSNARVEWEVNTETDVTGFDLYRRGAADPSYSLLTSIVPTGQRRYAHTDRTVHRGAAAPTDSYTYRLTVRGATEQTYSTTLTPTPSAVQRSWGTIKSMFR